MNRWLKTKDAAKYGGVSVRTLRDWIKNGLVHAKLPTGRLLFHPQDIDEYLRRYATGGVSETIIKKAQDVVDRVLRG